MNFTGKKDKKFYYEGLELKEGRKYNWKGRVEKLYNIVEWNCKMKVEMLNGEKILIRSYDDNEITEWTFERLKKSEVCIVPLNKNVKILKILLIFVGLITFIISIPFNGFGLIGLGLVRLSKTIGFDPEKNNNPF